MFQALQYKQIDTDTANNDKAVILLATPLVPVHCLLPFLPFLEDCLLSWKNSFPNTQLNHCTWPSVLWGHHILLPNPRHPLPVLFLMNLSEGQDLLDDSLLHKTHSSLGLHSDCFLVFLRFLAFPCLFCFLQWTHSVLSILQMMTFPQCPLRPTAHPVHICSPSSGRFDFLLSLLCPAFGYSSWLMAKFTNSNHRPNTKYLCIGTTEVIFWQK